MTGRSWEERALCRETGPEAFELEHYSGQALQDAKDTCQRCPVRVPCLEDALAHEIGDHTTRATIRGGLTPRERAAIAKQRRQVA